MGSEFDTIIQLERLKCIVSGEFRGKLDGCLRNFQFRGLWWMFLCFFGT